MKQYLKAFFGHLIPPPKEAAELFISFAISTLSMIIALVSYSLIVDNITKLLQH